MGSAPKDKWHDAAWAAAHLARHSAIVCGAKGEGGAAIYHTERALEKLRAVAEALGFTLVATRQAVQPSPTVTILPLDPEEEAA